MGVFIFSACQFFKKKLKVGKVLRKHNRKLSNKTSFNFFFLVTNTLQIVAHRAVYLDLRV